MSKCFLFSFASGIALALALAVSLPAVADAPLTGVWVNEASDAVFSFHILNSNGVLTGWYETTTAQSQWSAETKTDHQNLTGRADGAMATVTVDHKQWALEQSGATLWVSMPVGDGTVRKSPFALSSEEQIGAAIGHLRAAAANVYAEAQKRADAQASRDLALDNARQKVADHELALKAATDDLRSQQGNLERDRTFLVHDREGAVLANNAQLQARSKWYYGLWAFFFPDAARGLVFEASEATKVVDADTRLIAAQLMAVRRAESAVRRARNALATSQVALRRLGASD